MNKPLEEAFALAGLLSERDLYFFVRLVLGELLGEGNESGIHGTAVPEVGGWVWAPGGPGRLAELTPAYRTPGGPLAIDSWEQIPQPAEPGAPTAEELLDVPHMLREAQRHAFALTAEQQSLFADFLRREAEGELRWEAFRDTPESQEPFANLAEEALKERRAGKTRPLFRDDL